MAEQNQRNAGGEIKFESIAATRAPTMVTQYLKGIKFPATQEQLLQRAKENDAPEGVLENIGKMPKGNYQQMIDVTHNLGKVIGR